MIASGGFFPPTPFVRSKSKSLNIRALLNQCSDPFQDDHWGEKKIQQQQQQPQQNHADDAAAAKGSKSDLLDGGFLLGLGAPIARGPIQVYYVN